MSTEATLYNKKWQKFLSRVWLFRFIPFVDFVLAAGSLATGNVHENSDFDVIVGVQQGRIFTARMLCYIGFGMFGWRAVHKGDNPKRWRNKICLNHFMTPNAYRLSPPYNEYWKNLYRSLVPVYGSPAVIQKFYDANAEWTGPHTITNSAKKIPALERQNLFGVGVERVLEGIFSDWLEKKLKKIQIKKINAGLKFRTDIYTPRIIVNNNELEFHPDTRRIENYIE